MGSLKTCRSMLVLLGGLAIAALSEFTQAALVEPAIWRPTRIPTGREVENPEKIRQWVSRASYTEGDQDMLLQVALGLKPEEATQILIGYVDYMHTNGLARNIAWGRAVYCLGLTQTDTALQRLLALWRHFDGGLGDGSIRLPVSRLNVDVLPLDPIVDAIHFYFHRTGVRTWAMKEYGGIAALHKSAQGLEYAHRIGVRGQLMRMLYMWDIIETIDTNGLQHDNMTREATYRPRKVRDCRKAATRVIDHAKQLKDIDINASALEWEKIRSPAADYCLDQVTGLLGKGLAIALWEEGLSPSGTTKPLRQEHELRLWLTAVWAYLRGTEAEFPSRDEHPATSRVFLDAAVSYFRKLPEGHMRNLGIEALYAIGCNMTANDPGRNAALAVGTLLRVDLRRVIERDIEEQRLLNRSRAPAEDSPFSKE